MTPETASVVAAAIAAVAAIGVALLGFISTRQHRSTRDALAINTGATREVLHQVKNDHGTNLRDDLDGLAEQVASLIIGLSTVEAGQARMASMVGNVRRKLHDVADAQASHDAASLIIVEELHKTDRALAREIAKHHPPK